MIFNNSKLFPLICAQTSAQHNPLAEIGMHFFDIQDEIKGTVNELRSSSIPN